jgi:hypothetical protein
MEIKLMMLMRFMRLLFHLGRTRLGHPAREFKRLEGGEGLWC